MKNICTWTIVYFLLSLSIDNSVIAGRLYKWVDESGQVHYTDKPPIGKEAEKRKLPSTPNTNDNSTYSDNPSHNNNEGYRSNPGAVLYPHGRPSSTNMRGLRPGEAEALRNYESDIRANKKSRSASLDEHERQKKRCEYARKKHQEALNTPGRKSYAKALYEDIREECR